MSPFFTMQEKLNVRRASNVQRAKYVLYRHKQFLFKSFIYKYIYISLFQDVKTCKA